MTNLLNEMFGFSHVINISFCFYIILTDINYAVTHYHDLPTFEIIAMALWMANSPLIIVYLSQSVTRTFTLVQSITHHLSEMNICVYNATLLNQIETSQLDFMHHSIFFHAKGLILINNTTLLKLTGASIALIVIYIQFYKYKF
ncbi:uncharacterized protein LOC116341387 [Contarinia nasturtii]|uniref:uncharacterized protein LOC116341387 n=1 Tax=Contarinia nasturtii TaxID=265458 RepID=UPI0012D3E6E9|nr:uncharacterized protein LOC116341387 [Contarinia nasturtii]